MKTLPLKVVERPWQELKPHPDNPRNGDIDAIVASLRKNGLYRPIVTTRDGTILAGNHTYMAAGQIGMDSLSAVVLDLDPFSDEALRIMLADNRTADLGRYDDGILFKLMETLNQSDDGLDGTGYTNDDFSHLLIEDPPLDFDEIDVDAKTEHVCPSCGYAWNGKDNPAGG